MMYLNNRIKSALTLLLILLMSACSTDVPVVSPNQASEMLSNKQAVIIDVREQKERDEQHIESSIFIPLDQLESRMSELMQYKDRPIIMQCRSGRRSNIAGGRLIDAGFTKVYNLDGGILAWDKQGLGTVRGVLKRAL